MVPERNICTHFCPKNLKGNTKLTFCCSQEWSLSRQIHSNWKVAADNMRQLLPCICTPVHVTHVSIKLASQSKLLGPLCQGARRQICHPEGFHPKNSSYWVYSPSSTILSAASSDSRKSSAAGCSSLTKLPSVKIWAASGHGESSGFIHGFVREGGN